MKKKMRAKRLLYLLSWPGLLCLVGCAGPGQFEAREPICRDNLAKDEVKTIAEDVLAEMHFIIEKSDLEQGYIRTKPLPGGQFFEIWRSDNHTTRQALEANLHAIRRTAELNLTQVQGQLCIDCKVNIRRLSLPEREVNSPARAYSLFSESAPLLQKLELSDEQKREATWMDLGADTRLETEILNRIEKRIAQGEENR